MSGQGAEDGGDAHRRLPEADFASVHAVFDQEGLEEEDRADAADRHDADEEDRVAYSSSGNDEASPKRVIASAKQQPEAMSAGRRPQRSASAAPGICSSTMLSQKGTSISVTCVWLSPRSSFRYMIQIGHHS